MKNFTTKLILAASTLMLAVGVVNTSHATDIDEIFVDGTTISDPVGIMMFFRSLSNANAGMHLIAAQGQVAEAPGDEIIVEGQQPSVISGFSIFIGGVSYLVFQNIGPVSVDVDSPAQEAAEQELETILENSNRYIDFNVEYHDFDGPGPLPPRLYYWAPNT